MWKYCTEIKIGSPDDSRRMERIPTNGTRLSERSFILQSSFFQKSDKPNTIKYIHNNIVTAICSHLKIAVNVLTYISVLATVLQRSTTLMVTWLVKIDILICKHLIISLPMFYAGVVSDKCIRNTS